MILDWNPKASYGSSTPNRTMGRGFAGDVERGESAALLGRDASTSGGYDDEHGVDGDGGAGWMTHATDGVLGSSSSTSNRKTRERARATRRGLAVAAAACGVACAAAVGVWTHKSETLQEKWRPVPGAEMMTATAATRGRNAGIARWAARGSDGSVARLGEADTSALTGVTPTASQMMALRALRLQIRNAMFDPHTSSQTVATLSKQLLNVVPEARGALPTGAASTVDELDGVVKALMANGTSAEVPAPAVEGEFRELTAPDSRRTSVPVDDPNPLERVTQDPPPRKPLTSYESALFETRAAARQTAAIGKERRHSDGHSSELQTVRAEDKLEQMINSLDASGEPRADVDFTRESPRASARDYDMMQQQEARYNDPQAVDEYQPQPSYSDAYAPQQPRQQMPSEEEPVRFDGRDAFAPQPNFDAQAFEPTVEEEPERPSALEVPDEHAAPWESEEESTPLEAAQPAAVEEKKPEEHEDVSWTEFSGESGSGNDDNDDDGIEPTPDPSPMPTPEPSPEPDPMPEPDDPLDIDSLFANTGDAQASVVNDDDDDDDVKDENKHASSSSRSRGHHRSDVSTSSPSRMVKPLVPKADAKAIAGKVVDMIMSQMGTSDDSANVGSTLDGVSHPPFNPQLSKDEIAAQLVSALTAMSTEVVEQNAELSAAATDAAAPTTANTKIIADALVEHDEKMAQRIARVLARDSLFDDDDAAAMGSSRRARHADDDISKLILYEESRRQRDELQAMRRDLAALMANIQANYAMGVTQDRIDKTAAAAAGHIVDKLRPVFSRGDDGTDAVASTGESELSDSTLFDYPVMPSSKLSKETLRLDGFGAGISLDGSDGQEDSLDARLTGGDSEEDNYEADSDDDGDDSVSALDSLDLLSHASKKSSSSSSSDEPTLADQMSKGATHSRKSKDDSKTSSDENVDALPAWAGANALSDAELTAGFVSDETDLDGESIVAASSSSKSSKSRKKKKSSSLGLDEADDDDDVVTKSDATAKQNDYIASLTRRARDALKNRRHL